MPKGRMAAAITRVCPNPTCETPFITDVHKKVYCTKKCGDDAWRLAARPKRERACRRCSAEFVALGGGDHHYCPACTDCAVGGCSRPRKERGYCGMHALRDRRRGDPGDAAKLPAGRPTTGRYVHGQGYVFVKVGPTAGPGRGWAQEHRWVMEQAMGRALRSHEEVHHRNTVRADNRLENLELWTRPQPPGGRVEDLVAWVVAEYPDLVAELLSQKPAHLSLA